MRKTAVLICPGRGTYTRQELGTLARQHPDKTELFAAFDQIRKDEGQEEISVLDGAHIYRANTYTRGDIASPLIYAASLADAQSVDRDIEIVAVTGNSMGWYSALAVAGAVSAVDGFCIANTMGRLMQDKLIGGQVVYPFVAEDWRDAPAHKEALLTIVKTINMQQDHFLDLSIDLGGMLVLAGNDAGISAFMQKVPPVQGRYPLRLKNHAGFHTALQQPVAAAGQTLLPVSLVKQPDLPLIDGRGHVWWPHATDTAALWKYTLSHQITQLYDFTHAVRVAAREFAPDYFIITGPGTTLGGAVAQSLIIANWKGMNTKADFQHWQKSAPFVISMGRDDQRGFVVEGGGCERHASKESVSKGNASEGKV